MAESRPSKPVVASSSLAPRSIRWGEFPFVIDGSFPWGYEAGVAQLAEPLIRNQQVRGSTPRASSTFGQKKGSLFLTKD